MKNNASREKLLDAAFLEVYKNGYHGAATAAILKEAGVPKGSMYHHFDSKKALVLATIKERLFPKMDLFFNFSLLDGESSIEALMRSFKAISQHPTLITYGCPLYRLIVEMASLDKDFDSLLSSRYKKFVSDLKTLLDTGIREGELSSFDTQSFAEFAITSSWGRLSLSPSLSTKEQFLTHTQFLIDLLNTHKL